jgi:hypothetical protein
MNKNQIVGRAIALSAAIFYGFNTTLWRLAYDTGGIALIVVALFLSHWKAPGLMPDSDCYRQFADFTQ